MSSLWTPDGERRINTAQEDDFAAQAPPPQHATAGDDGQISPEVEAQYREEMERLERDLLDAPVGDVIANHCYGIFQLAALHLGQQPPHLDEAKLAIDALGAVIDTLGIRIGDAATTLNEGLAQIRLAYVQIAAAHDGPDGLDHIDS